VHTKGNGFMNDLLQHTIATASELHDHLLIMGITKEQDGVSEIVYFAKGDVSVLRGFSETALHNLSEEENDKN